MLSGLFQVGALCLPICGSCILCCGTNPYNSHHVICIDDEVFCVLLAFNVIWVGHIMSVV